MVDVSRKSISLRKATARCYVRMQSTTIKKILNGSLEKGDVFAVARIAGIQASKKCADMIPLCHPVNLSYVDVELVVDALNNRVVITASCQINGVTGVEMESLTAVSIAALTLYDMCKAIDKKMVIEHVFLVSKLGGKTGDKHFDEPL